MNISKRTKYVVGTPLFVLAVLAAQLTHVVPTYAATLTWTGGGDGTSFSDGDNWNTGNAPVNGDDLTFNVANLAGATASEVLNNDISNLSVAGISFTGALPSYYRYILAGNSFTLTGNVTNTTTGQYADSVPPTIENNITLGADVTIDSVTIGAANSTLNLQSNALTFSGTSSCGLTMVSNLSGSGALNVSATNANITGSNGSFTGPINVTGDAVFLPVSFGAASAGTTVSGSGVLGVLGQASISVAEPFTFGGSGSFASVLNLNSGCMSGAGDVSTTTLTGGVTLTSNFVYSGDNHLVINEPYTSNDFNFTVQSGVTGSLETPEGTVEAPEETISLDGDSATFVNIGNKQTAILNGTRNGISVGQGGVLKGNGTANTVNVNTGGTIAPGNSPGVLTVLETLNLTGTYQAELLNRDTYDQLAVGENYTGGGNAVYLNSGVLNLVLFEGWSINQGDTFAIINNLSSTAVQGTFDGLAEGAQLVVDGITFSISYVGGDGNDVVLTALNTGTDPDAPNTGVAQFVQANPAVIAGLGLLAAALLFAVAMKRRGTQ